jgi:L-2-hydroxyglutarate oxidase LhgO
MDPSSSAPATPGEAVDCVVIGAGVVGLACARALALAGREVIVLDAADTHGTGISSRNSEVLHAGLHYPPGSLRARLCVQGRRQLVDYCVARGVPHRLCGKLVVAHDEAEAPRLQALLAQARACGVHSLREWSREDVHAAEPALDVHAALWSPDTGIVDGAALMLALRADAEAAGATFVFRSPVRGLAIGRADGVAGAASTARAGGGSGGGGGSLGSAAHVRVEVDGVSPVTLEARGVVNSAGLHALALARGTHGQAPAYAAALPPSRYAKGAYFELAGRAPFTHLVYPVPGVSSHLGVHLTLDLAGRARFGPGFEWVDRVDTTVDADQGPAFEAAVRRYWPGLPVGALQPAFAGVRPKLTGPGEPAADFRIDGPAAHGVPGLVHLLGIESPGLTSSLAIAEAVAAAIALG